MASGEGPPGVVAGAPRPSAPPADPTGPSPDSVEVSILVLVYRDPDNLCRCLDSVFRCVPRDIPFEVVVLDNGGPPGRLARAQRLFPWVRSIQVPVNLGFGGGCNRAARAARGRFLVLLNDDATVLSGWLEALLQAVEDDPRTGVVGSRIVRPDGSLQEAGSVVWRDGSTWGVGRGRPPHGGDFDFRRDVDYCSAASWLVRREVWQAVGGMDEEFHPAYGEDVDFCLRARQLGWRVVYEPRSRIVHLETASSDVDARTFLIERNRARLRQKWSQELALRLPPPAPAEREAALLRAVHLARGAPPRLLVIDDRYPEQGLGSGFPRMMSVLQDLAAVGAVSFFPSAGRDGDRSWLQRIGVEVVGESLEEHLRRPETLYDVVLVSRPHNYARFAASVRRWQPQAVLVYDAEALFYRRLERQAEVTGDATAAREAREMRAVEEQVFDTADWVVCLSQAEAEVVRRRRGDGRVRVLEPRGIAARLTDAGFWQRRDLLAATGWLHGGPSPNVDGLRWVATEVLPRVRSSLPWTRLLVTGGQPPPEVAGLAGPSLSFLGHVPDLVSVYAAVRVAVVPMRFGSGVKIKTVEALLHGVPVVATSVGAEGIEVGGEPAIVIADDAEAFAEAVVTLLCDRAAWERRRRAIERLLARWEAIPAHSWSQLVREVLSARRQRPAISN